MSACSFGECVKEAKNKGLCSGHYRQQLAGGEMKPLRPQRSSAEVLARDEQGRKQCTACGEWKAEFAFHRGPKATDGLQAQCRECNRSLGIAKRYGISADQYAALVTSQGGVCAICEQPPTARGFVVDHDHACCAGLHSCGACVRGLLCISCNSGIGLLGDDPSILLNAIAYLSQNGVAA